MPKITLDINHPPVHSVLKKFVPTFLGVGVLQVLGLVNTGFASLLDPGALSYINLADRLLELPMSLIAVSLGTTLLPTLSTYWASGEKDNLVLCLQKHFQLFYFLALPAAFGLWFIGSDIISVLFSRGEFTASEVPIVAMILKIYCLTLLAAGSMKIFNQGFYAMGDTKTPAYIALMGLIIHLILAPILMNWWALKGLILSTASISLINVCTGVFILQKRLSSLDWNRLAQHFVRCFVAASVMGIYLFALSHWSWRQGRFLLDFPVLILLVALAGLLYFGAAMLLQVDELEIIMKKIKKR